MKQDWHSPRSSEQTDFSTYICSHASKTADPYISELAEAAVGDELGT